MHRYEDFLYNFLTEFNDHPRKVRQEVKIVVAYCVDLYDACLKLSLENWNVEPYESFETEMDRVCSLQEFERNPKIFKNYLLKKEKITLKELEESMQQMGLLFL